MPRSIPVLALLLLGAGCAQPSQSPPMVTAPSASATPAQATTTPTDTPTTSAAPSAAPPPTASAAPPAPSAASAGALPAQQDDSNVPGRFRACAADTDCVAVPRGGCCNHGYKEAVSTSQTDAYAKFAACVQTPRPICPMFMIRDTRVAKCDGKERLCVMVKP